LSAGGSTRLELNSCAEQPYSNFWRAFFWLVTYLPRMFNWNDLAISLICGQFLHFYLYINALFGIYITQIFGKQMILMSCKFTHSVL